MGETCRYIEQRSIAAPPSTCRLWLLSVDRAGYGFAWRAGRAIKAHRLAYEAHVGPIADGAHVLHRCDTPSCVNPDHLFLGTNADNVADRVSKRRTSRTVGEANGRAKLSGDLVYQIRAMLGEGRTQTDIARDLGLHRNTVGEVARGERWSV